MVSVLFVYPRRSYRLQNPATGDGGVDSANAIVSDSHDYFLQKTYIYITKGYGKKFREIRRP